MIDRAPFVPPEDLWLYNAFCALSRERPVGLGPAPIPIGALETYCRMNGIVDEEGVAMLTAAVHAMDDEWLAWALERQEVERKQRQSKR